ncbi:SUMF1/EgtB/PvdO family nonheme iron enzyme [Candidatus Viridilinea mediisalina]|uniref:Sulfatase-modifying factor enzyme-like domain-containing protein n=1 Tax=Candidatus Viridilinea mediisalina TaxID=2024553 RepID=A0A2A6REB6_9CHLR|nr:SUMF1/EgtB/PvdO family nonheme iron enzyme [Candidatus Viridilinea mediisalina]PDW00667.1 hypothetical protein CJ255_20320 [Candidatus Viridilinea mediisalina]
MGSWSDSLLVRLRRAVAALAGAPDHDPREGTVTVSGSGTVYGNVVGFNLGQVIFGRDPSEDERRRIVWYLEGLMRKLQVLPLRGLDEQLGQSACLELPRIYVTLATTTRLAAERGTKAQLSAFFEQGDPDRPLKQDYHPDHALPDRARYRVDGAATIDGQAEAPVVLQRSLTGGQIRHFTRAWYEELVTKGQLDQAQAERLCSILLRAIGDPQRPRLREMAKTPLLLTLMALVLYNKGELPRDRPQLYERILELLLGQWDHVREGQSLGQAIGMPTWDSSYIRPLLDRLSYEAHGAASSQDGRGRLARGEVYTALIDFFQQTEVASPGDAAVRCLDYIDQRSGLLLPDGADTFTFAHLTLQEHCAGRQIALNAEDPVALVMAHRHDDRWREPIFLGVGLAPPLVLDRLFNDLIEREEAGKSKPVARWYRDLILAAELGADRDWSYLRTRPQIRATRWQAALKQGLEELLADRVQPLPVAERVRAGFLLGDRDLGDPRFPVTVDEWRNASERALAGDANGYFCPIPAGTYWIGSANDDPDAKDEERPQHTITLAHPIYIARYPLTNAQWRAWVRLGDGQPSYTDDDSDLNHPNQPVVGVSWVMANAYCAWFSTAIGADLRLPSEQEWEAAARGGDRRRYPWGDDWREDHAATEEDRATRGWRWSIPVGCYPAGAAPCGALDMAGNVREWMVNTWQSYPGAERVFADEERWVLRGGDYDDSRTNVRCGARLRFLPGYDLSGDRGFRVLLSPLGIGESPIAENPKAEHSRKPDSR